MQFLQYTESIYRHYFKGLLQLFWFLFNQENLYMIHHNSDLFFDIFNAIS